jgi:hypothetical protein
MIIMWSLPGLYPDEMLPDEHIRTHVHCQYGQDTAFIISKSTHLGFVQEERCLSTRAADGWTRGRVVPATLAGQLALGLQQWGWLPPLLELQRPVLD